MTIRRTPTLEPKSNCPTNPLLDQDDERLPRRPVAELGCHERPDHVGIRPDWT